MPKQNQALLGRAPVRSMSLHEPRSRPARVSDGGRREGRASFPDAHILRPGRRARSDAQSTSSIRRRHPNRSSSSSSSSSSTRRRHHNRRPSCAPDEEPAEAPGAGGSFRSSDSMRASRQAVSTEAECTLAARRQAASNLAFPASPATGNCVALRSDAASRHVCTDSA